MSSRNGIIHTIDGVVLSTRTWPASVDPVATVVLVHGFSGSKDHPEVVNVAEALSADGYRVLSYDGRGHHSSGGLCTLGDLERHDVAAAVAEARKSADRVVTVGASMGGIAVVRHASEHGDVDGVVAVSTPARWKLPRSVKAVLAAGLTRTGAGRALAKRALGVRVHPEWASPPSPEEAARGIVAPLAIVHGEADRIVPAGEAYTLAAAGTAPSRLDLVPGMGHAYHHLGIPAVLESVAWVLGRTAWSTP